MGALETIITILSPPCCINCNKQGFILCDDCLHTQVATKKPACFWCNRLTLTGATCQTCRPKTYLGGAIIPFRFKEPINELIYRLKYNGDRAVGRYFANLIASQIAITGFNTITYVASTGASQRQRGYNQAKIIAKELSNITGLPLQNMLLRKSHQDQIGLNRAQRLKSVQGNFMPTSHSALGKRIIIVDDVVTTGATLNECARILKESGASRVWGVAVAKK